MFAYWLDCEWDHRSVNYVFLIAVLAVGGIVCIGVCTRWWESLNGIRQFVAQEAGLLGGMIFVTVCFELVS